MNPHRLKQRFVRTTALAVTAVLVLGACTASDDSAESSGGTAADSTTPAPTATGPAPGVTVDAIKIGVTYVDVEALLAIGVEYDLGDYEGIYQALIDDINDSGGIHGRQLDPVFVPVDPVSPAPAEAACVRLTEDEDVFAVVGFWLDDTVVCPVGAHSTAVIGGTMTPDRLDQATAPWVSPNADADQPAAVLRAMDDRGELDGTIGVYAGNSPDQAVLDGQVLPTLEELGHEVAETGVVAAPPEDRAAVENDTGIIAERFAASGVDTVVVVGQAGVNWPASLADDTSYRPKLLFLDPAAPQQFFDSPDTTDTSVLEGSLTGGPFGPDQARFEEAEMQACAEIAAAAGVEVVPPDEAGDDPSNMPFQALFMACPDMALLRALLDAAGEDLNYGTLAAAANGLEVAIPGDPEARTYGPPPDADGDPRAYLFAWDEEAGDNLPVDP